MTVEIDPERQQEAKRYATQRRLLLVAQLIVGAGFLLVLVLSNLAVGLRNVLTGVPFGPNGQTAVYFVTLWLIYTVLSFPFSIVGGWSLPRLHGLSVQTFGQWIVDWMKGEGIGLVIGLVMVEVVYTLLRSIPQFWWLVTGILYLLFVVVLAQLGPILLLPLFFKTTPLAPSELTERLEKLARRAGMRIQGVYSLNLSSKTTAANAALTGIGSTRRIILGDTLLDRYTEPEIQVVFAHELGHHVHHDIPRMILEQSVVTLIALYVANLALIFAVGQFGYDGISDVATMPFLALVIGAIGTITAPLLNWESRRMERVADCYALRATDDPNAFISTMIRLANQNLAVYRPPRWEEILFYDHPAIADRVDLGEAYSRHGRCA